MFISKSNRSPYYQITYEVNSKRTTISTKTTELNEAYKFMASFNHLDKKQVPSTNNILFSKFIDEYLDYTKKTKSINYARSVKLSLKMLLQFTGDIYFYNFHVYTFDKFLNEIFTRTPRGASLY
jgi:hypothetical protein